MSTALWGLCLFACGFTSGTAGALALVGRRVARDRRAAEAHLRQVMQLAKLTVDLSTQTGVTMAQAEHAISNALMVHRRKT